jgi:hypothetical protein
MKLVVVYGFENEWKIYFKRDTILCKSLITNEPVYAAPYIIEDTNIDYIIEKIKFIEKFTPELLFYVNKLAYERSTQAKWQVVLYSEKIKFNIGYESEGDENGDGR